MVAFSFTNELENGGQQRISGLATFEVIHEKILVNLISSYDFLFNYLTAEKNSHSNTIAVFQKWGDQIIQNGVPDNNWNLFQARFLTYVALVLDSNKSYENGKGREYFIEYTFNTSTERQYAIKEALLVYDQETGIWPESAGYSVHVIASLLDIFTLLDHSTNKNELSNFPIVEKAALATFQYLFPSGYIVGFGDGGHSPIPPDIFELLMAQYRKYNQAEKETLMASLLQQMMGKKEYTRKADNLFELFFYVDSLHLSHKSDNSLGIKTLTSPTFYAPNVSLFNQRLGAGKDAVMVSSVGSFGNHAHVNGLSIELFANNYVLAPDMGRGPSYWHPEHREFYSRMPAHNTVVVDGSSDYDAMRGHHAFKVENYFPALGKQPIFDKLTFSSLAFFEPKTTSDQKRLTAIIKSNSNKSYVIDVFRSKKQEGGKQRHDYFYHGLGQSLQLLDNRNKALALTPTKDFGSKNGDLKAYDYMTDKQKIETSDNVQALFRLKDKGMSDNLMKIWIKGSPNQQLYSAKSPKSNAISKGTAPVDILDEPIPTLIIKREAAAWENPFALVFNPFIEGEENPIDNVNFSTLKEYPATQVIEILLSDKKTTDKIVLNASETDIVAQNKFYQKGLLSVIRQSKDKSIIDFILLSGMNKFEYNDWAIETSGEAVSLSFEYIEGAYFIQNDKPVTLKIPILKGKKSAELRLYEDSKLVGTRQSVISRTNAEQLEFRLEKAYNKAVIVFKE